MLTKLYGILPSPPVRSVLLCAKALDIKLNFININLLEGEHMQQDFLKVLYPYIYSLFYFVSH